MQKSHYISLDSFIIMWYYSNSSVKYYNGEQKMKEIEKQIEGLRKRLDLLVKDLEGFDKGEILSLSQELDKVLNEFIEQVKNDDK